MIRRAVAFVLATVVTTRAGAQELARHTYRPGLDVLGYDFAIDLPDTGRVIDGRATLTVRRGPAVRTLPLDFLEPMRVDSVLVNGRQASFQRDSVTVRIALPDDGGDSLSVVVRYHGAPRDGLIIGKDPKGRWIGFGDNFPDRGRHWLPTIDHPSDKATVSWTVTAPSDRRVVAGGELLEERPLPPASNRGRPRTLTRWREARAVPVYVMVIAAAPLVRYDLGQTACGLSEFAGCVPQQVYVAPEERDFLPGPFTTAAGIVELFSRLVAPFPYEKLAHLQTTTRFGGMENSSAIFYGDRQFRNRSMQPGLIAHETAHQWFGDAVTEREWGHIWLSEGFASYFAQLWVEATRGDSAFRAGMSQLRDQVLGSPVTLERPVIDTTQRDLMRLLNSNSYQKGAWVLHMLRATVGDSAFFQGVRAYYLAHRHGTALTDDLRVEVERTSGMELGWFFDQWLRRPGYAEVSTSWRWDAPTSALLLTIDQGTRFPPYRFELDVELRASDGTFRRVPIEVKAERRTEIPIRLGLTAAPAAVVFDPDVRVLGKISGR